MRQTKVTIYKSLYTEEAHQITLEAVLERIRTGNKSGELINDIRTFPDKKDQDELKKTLPCICFSGIIPTGPRTDARITNHTHLAILDFDNLTPNEFAEKKRQFISLPYTVAAFLSPRGNGLKVLIRIKEGLKHREHYKAILHEFEGLDKTNINPSRVCFESFDPEIFINYDAISYNKIAKETEVKVYKAKDVTATDEDKFKNLCKWMENKAEAFASGSRNNYIHKLAGACCRFGIDQYTAKELLHQEYLSTDADFKVHEMDKAVESAYRRNNFNSAEFDDKSLVDTTTRKEVEIIEDTDFVEDVIYGQDVLTDALRILKYGYESAETTGIPEVDKLWKWKKGELNVMTGIGNHGKSTFFAFMMLNKSALDGTRWGIFSPESYPPHEFYHHLSETVLGAICNPHSLNIPSEELYKYVYEWVAEHFYYIYPKSNSPTPEYIKSRFLELIIKNKISGCVIDPYNQMTNDYTMRDDKYLEAFLADCSRFALTNNVFFTIVAHPHKLRKNEAGGYDAPDIFDLAGGAMWNNKADNILVYHRPNRHTDPKDLTCELHTKKIRRQTIVGSIDVIQFDYSPYTKRFVFPEFPIKQLLKQYGIDWGDSTL